MSSLDEESQAGSPTNKKLHEIAAQNNGTVVLNKNLEQESTIENVAPFKQSTMFNDLTSIEPVVDAEVPKEPRNEVVIEKPQIAEEIKEEQKKLEEEK